jgi:hypothetical protein
VEGAPLVLAAPPLAPSSTSGTSRVKLLRIPFESGETTLVLDLVVAVERQTSYVVDREWTLVTVRTLTGVVDVCYLPSAVGDAVYEQIVAAVEAHDTSIEIIGAVS